MSLRKARISKNVSQEQLAVLLGVSVAMISRYERGLSTLSASNAKKLSEFLEVPMEDIVANDPAMLSDLQEPIANLRASKNSRTIFAVRDKLEFLSDYFWELLEIYKRADGHCECCGDAVNSNGPRTPCLEFFQLYPNEDLVEYHHVVAVCPTCHMRLRRSRYENDDSLIRVVIARLEATITGEEDPREAAQRKRIEILNEKQFSYDVCEYDEKELEANQTYNGAGS